MSVTTTCPSSPYAGLWTANGTRRDVSGLPNEPMKPNELWTADKYAVTEDSETIAVVVRYKPWPYERMQVCTKYSALRIECLWTHHVKCLGF